MMTSVEMIPCACGQCDLMIPSIDKWGIPRRFARGHHRRGKGLQGSDHPNWNGGYRIKNGYLTIKKLNHPRADTGGYVPISILVYEEYYKCCILSDIIMYHKDGNNSNDHPLNLQPSLNPNLNERLTLVKKE